MNGYYLVNDTSCPVATAAREVRKLEFELWAECIPEHDADIELFIQNLATATGRGTYQTKKILFALYRIHELPQLLALQHESYFLDISRLTAIDLALNKLGAPSPEALEQIDAALCEFFTPTKPRQVLPSNRAITKFIYDLLRLLDDNIEPESKEEESRNDSYSTYPVPGGREAISAEYDAATAFELDKHIKDTAEKLEITPAAALEKLIRGEANSQATVILNMYRASDLKDAPAFIQDVGWVSAEVADTLEPTVVRDMEKAETAVSSSYTTPATIRAYVEGRDLTCRIPGCDRPAWECQMDHRINFADGGQTTASNLVSLCQPHHNLKTDGRVWYIMDEETNDIIWLFDDGHYEFSRAEGPLAPKKRNWLRTFMEAVAARRREARANCLKDEER
ncbi:HNH endonuclease signature motif containing protein [Corynebacterium striatum]|uniref:HNH endonuclease signature motif containing protein n=1 Tax=Corynebacterium striatum TaxID=43770 RepID=UPI0027BA9197|nr:HNH endonuclease signature motif containing protein [Corynebacterium striatum]